MLTFNFCCATGYNAVTLLLHYNVAVAGFISVDLHFKLGCASSLQQEKKDLFTYTEINATACKLQASVTEPLFFSVSSKIYFS